MTSTSTQKAPKGAFRSDACSASRAPSSCGKSKSDHLLDGEKMLAMKTSNRMYKQLSAEVEVARHDKNARIFEALANAWVRTVEATSSAFARIVEAVAGAPWIWLLLIALWERFQ